MNIRRNFKMCLFDYKNYAAAMSVKHQRLRSDNSKAIYPSMLAKNLILHTYAVQLSWQHVRERLDLVGQPEDFEKAFSEAVSFMQPFKQKVLSDLDTLWQSCPLKGGISFDNIKILEKRAITGDNKAVEELEFCCVAHSVIYPITENWLALGLNGYPIVSAFLKSVEYVPSDSTGRLDSELLDNYLDYARCVNAAAFASIGGSGQYQGAYISLPPLW